MNTMLQVKTTHNTDRRVEFNSKLAAAHARIEKRFLDGGAVLVSVMEILNDLMGILDGMTATFDGKTASATASGLRKTISDLAILPETERKRQAGFEALASMCTATCAHIEDIDETIRYLKTFAVTVKIAGAGLSEFAGFADEIRERIQSGADEVRRFAANLEAMRSQLEKAQSFSTSTLSDFSATIPHIIEGLNENSARIASQHKEMADIAAQVKKIAQGVQAKIASVLSALQIGDISRQRIEHIQSTLEHFDEFTRSGDGARLGSAEHETLHEAVMQLVGAQMDEMAADFQRECSRIFASISSFTDDAARILSMRDQLVESTSSGDANILSLMEKDIFDACQLAERVQGSSADADDVVTSVTQSAQELLRGIEVLRSIKIDIHYMALNSNLRCSKLGDEGRSVNVVSGEMRIFAAKLETPADAIVDELQRVEAATQKLMKEGQGLSADLRLPLQDALESIRQAKSQIDHGMQALAEEGQAVFSRISAAVVTLDFESELGATISQCCGIAAELSQGFNANVSTFADKIEPLSNRIFKLYTMSQEREIHLRFLPSAVSLSGSAPASAPSPSTSLVEDDDDLFADALF